MNKTYLSFFLALIFIVGPVTAHASSERGTKEEAVTIVNRIVEFFNEHGAEETFSVVTKKTNADFFNKDLYPFIYDLEGKNVAHGAKPHLVGKDLIGLKDTDGVALIQEMVVLGQKKETGWVNYKWPDPNTNSVTDKSSYISPLGDNYFVGVGIYLE